MPVVNKKAIQAQGNLSLAFQYLIKYVQPH